MAKEIEMSTVSAARPQFQVNDWVSFRRFNQTFVPRIASDLGPIGRGGARVYEVRLEGRHDDQSIRQETEDDLRAVEEPTASILSYLTGPQGLLDLLSRNRSGGGDPPRAWLRVESDGRVRPSFQKPTSDEAGWCGGQVIPFGAIERGRVYSGCQAEVIDFLKSFGLTESQAEAVIRDVGTYPV
jgi:hypothetical protein